MNKLIVEVTTCWVQGRFARAKDILVNMLVADALAPSICNERSFKYILFHNIPPNCPQLIQRQYLNASCRPSVHLRAISGCSRIPFRKNILLSIHSVLKSKLLRCILATRTVCIRRIYCAAHNSSARGETITSRIAYSSTFASHPLVDTSNGGTRMGLCSRHRKESIG